MTTHTISTKIRNRVSRWFAAIDKDALASSMVAMSGLYGVPTMYLLTPPVEEDDGQAESTQPESQPESQPRANWVRAS